MAANRQCRDTLNKQRQKVIGQMRISRMSWLLTCIYIPKRDMDMKKVNAKNYCSNWKAFAETCVDMFDGESICFIKFQL